MGSRKRLTSCLRVRRGRSLSTMQHGQTATDASRDTDHLRYQRVEALMATLSDLHQKYDGPVPQSELDYLDGLTPVLRAKFHVQFYRREVANWKEQRRRTDISEDFRRRALANLDWSRGELEKAEERLRVLEGPVAFGRDVFGGLLE